MAEVSLQPSFYSYVTMVNGLGHQEDLRLRFDVLTKTKQPEIRRYWTTRNRTATRRLYRLAVEVRHAAEGSRLGLGDGLIRPMYLFLPGPGHGVMLTKVFAGDFTEEAQRRRGERDEKFRLDEFVHTGGPNGAANLVIALFLVRPADVGGGPSGERQRVPGRRPRRVRDRRRWLRVRRAWLHAHRRHREVAGGLRGEGWMSA